jgi:hypothetical protein
MIKEMQYPLKAVFNNTYNNYIINNKSNKNKFWNL